MWLPPFGKCELKILNIQFSIHLMCTFVALLPWSLM